MDQGTMPDGEQLRALLSEIAGMHMPFGMYGPAKFPPHGCPIMDLPEEYLGWFQQRGFPKGKLGHLMEHCWVLRSNGLDHLFQPFREARGGRTSMRPRRKSYHFPES